jgi:uncharacterized membrane protein
MQFFGDRIRLPGGKLDRHRGWIATLEMQMTQKQQPALTLFAVGMIGLGILGLIFGDFALVWQPVASWFPGRTALAYCAAALMLLGGIGLLFEATVRWAIRILFPYLILWALLKVPDLVMAPQIEGVWLGFGELAVLLAGGWMLFARVADMPDRGVWKFVAGENGVGAARILFGVFLIPIGLSHLIYVKETVALVPHWLPFPIGWAYLTGAGQMACGLGVLFGVLPRVAALCEAGMISIFGLLVWLPRVAATPTLRLPWTAFWITWAIGAAAWVVAANIPMGLRRRSREPEPRLVAQADV